MQRNEITVDFPNSWVTRILRFQSWRKWANWIDFFNWEKKGCFAGEIRRFATKVVAGALNTYEGDLCGWIISWHQPILVVATMEHHGTLTPLAPVFLGIHWNFHPFPISKWCLLFTYRRVLHTYIGMSWGSVIWLGCNDPPMQASQRHSRHFVTADTATLNTT